MAAWARLPTSPANPGGSGPPSGGLGASPLRAAAMAAGLPRVHQGQLSPQRHVRTSCLLHRPLVGNSSCWSPRPKTCFPPSLPTLEKDCSATTWEASLTLLGLTFLRTLEPILLFLPPKCTQIPTLPRTSTAPRGPSLPHPSPGPSLQPPPSPPQSALNTDARDAVIIPIAQQVSVLLSRPCDALSRMGRAFTAQGAPPQDPSGQCPSSV